MAFIDAPMTTLVEKVARVLCKQACLGWSDEPDGNGDYFRDAARAALAVVHDHYSDPASVTKAMRAQATLYTGNMVNERHSRNHDKIWALGIAAAMKAAKDE